AFLNFVTEEVKDPSKNIPRNIYISIPLVTVIYILTNVAYLAVLTQVEMLSSNAVAVTFIQQFSPHASWAVSLCVATSTVGGMSGLLFTNSRLFFVASREGYLPSCLSMLNIYYFTPVPSLIFICVLSMSYLAITDVSVLMNYVGFVEALFLGVVMAGLVRLRYKQPNLERPIKVHISLPLIFLCVCIFLVALPFYERPWETGVGTAVTLTGVPVYMMILFCSGRPKLCERTAGKLTSVFQKVLLSVPEEKEN
ncbi:large neutral amino acids transporter small subunit 2, partial [Caerostris darwini]